MKDDDIKLYKELFEKYKESDLICYGSPDQFQYRQNQLLKCLANFILRPYFVWENDEFLKKVRSMKEDENEGN